MLFRDEMISRQAHRLLGEVLLTQSRSTRAMVVFLATIVIVLGTFALLGTYARTETVQGILVTDKPIVRIVVSRPGRLLRMFVREGDRVSAGSRLASIDVDVRRQGGAQLAKESMTLLDRQVREIRSQAVSAREAEQILRRQLDSRISGYREQIANVARQSELQRGILASNKDLFTRAEALIEQGFVTRFELERRRQAVIQAEQQLEILRQQAATATTNLQQTEMERRTVAIELARQLSTIEASLAAVERERLAVSGDVDFEVASPIAGRVTAIQVGTGQTVQPSVVMLTVIPDGAKLEAELYAPSRAIGFVRRGQAVSLLVDAFPYQKYGSVRAHISAVAATMIDPREAYTPFKIDEPVFKVRVELDPEQRGFDLQPGMTLTASIVLERRSFLDWLLSPLSAVTRRHAD